MIKINSDKDKKFINVVLVNHKNWPYGNQKLTYAINDLSIEAETELIKFNSSKTGGEQAYCFVNDLVIGDVQATMQNVNELFAKECYTNISATIDGDVTVDMSGVEELLEKISEQIKNISTSGGTLPSGDINAIMCKLGEVSCSLDNIAGEEIGGYYSVDECNRINDTLDEINNDINI